MNDELTIFDFMDDGEQYKPIASNDWKWTFADYPKKKNEIKVFSCFACCGGSTMGYKLAGCEVVGCLEIDKKMNDIYIANHHPKYNFLMDIRDFNNIPNDELPPELFDLDVLDGSPPCTTFSMVGKREQGWGKKKKFREGQAEQTLDDLSFIFCDTVAKLRPRVVVIENVEGLTFGNAWSYVQKIYARLIESGYSVNHWLLKGEQMGIPQKRHRCFFVAIRNDLKKDPRKLDMCFNYTPVLYKDIQQGEGEKLNEKTVLWYWLQKAIESDKKIADTVVRYGKPEKLFSHKICWPNDVISTVASAGEMFRGIEKTRVSIDDIISAQTFPQDYFFPKRNFDDVKYICGMSVPPVMMKRVVLRLIEEGVFDYKKEEQNNADSN